MRWALILALILSMTTASATPICEQREDENWGFATLSGFRVEANQPVYVGDTIYYSFNLKNTGYEPIKIGKGGIYLKTNLGDHYSFYAGDTIDPGKYLYVKSSFKVSSSGQLTLTPGICVSTAKGEMCHDFDTSCSFDVFVRCPDEASCITVEQASEGNYVQVSDGVCGYQISGLTAMIKTPMYCFREVFECPETCKCLTEYEAEKYGLMPCGGSEPRFCGYSKEGSEMYCYQQGMPDLRISDVWVYNTTPGIYSDLRALVYNSGDGYAANFTVAFFIDGSYVGEVTVDRLGVGEHTVAIFDYPHPCEGEQDILKAVVDYRNEVAESDEANNELTSPHPFVCSNGMPDLEVKALLDYVDFCRTLNYGNSSIVVVVTNTGNVTSPSTRGWVYIDGGSRGPFDIPSLQPGERYNVSLNFNYVCTGNEDEIRVAVDTQNSVLESDEDDNEFTFTTECFIRPSGSDLAITNLSYAVASVQRFADGRELPVNLVISYEIANIGAAYSCFSNTALYVDGHFKGMDAIPPLAPGETMQRTFSWQYDMRECSGNEDILVARADYRGDTSETNESNNNATLTIQCVEFPLVKPDLTVEDIWIDGSGVADLDIVFRVKNAGLARSAATIADVDVNYAQFAQIQIPPLDPGDSVELRAEDWTPQWEDNRITVCADSGNYVDEVPMETNNCLTKEIVIDGIGCDDGVRNRDEVGVDCGGRYCVQCGFVEIRGRILYEDDDGSFKPARFLKFRLEGAINWGPLVTDSEGYFAVPVPENKAGSSIHIKIEPWNANYAARIAKDLDYCNEYVWFVSNTITVPSKGRLGLGDLKVGKDVNYDFSAYWKEKYHSWGICGGSLHTFSGGSVYLNIADAILTARTYADAHRDDSDGIGKVDVQYPDADWSNYNNDWDEITLYRGNKGDHGFKDGTIVHEYGHFLEDKISEEDVYVGDTSHTFCTDKDDTEFAWSEGFAEYFGTFIVAINPHLSHPNIGYDTIESPTCSRMDDDIEATVAAVLWDMVDDSNPNESFDSVSGLDDVIFKMLDSELDHWYDAPDLCEMHEKLDNRLNPQTLSRVERIFEHYNACR